MEVYVESTMTGLDNANTNSNSSSSSSGSKSCSPGMTTTTGVKRPRSSSSGGSGSGTPELLRCKRRIHFGPLGYALPPAQPQAVARRNERERNRVKLVNLGFATLREHVPDGSKNKKMSKVETLRSAVDYIRQLQQMLNENDATMFGAAAFTADSPGSSAGLLASNENRYPGNHHHHHHSSHHHHHMGGTATHNGGLHCGGAPSHASPPCSAASSPTPSYASDASSYEPLSAEEEELLDFTSWFS